MLPEGGGATIGAEALKAVPMDGVKEAAAEGGGGIGGNWKGGGGIRPASGLKARPGGMNGGGPAT